MGRETVTNTVHATVQDHDDDPHRQTEALWEDFCRELEKLKSNPKYRGIYLM